MKLINTKNIVYVLGGLFVADLVAIIICVLRISIEPGLLMSQEGFTFIFWMLFGLASVGGAALVGMYIITLRLLSQEQELIKHRNELQELVGEQTKDLRAAKEIAEEAYQAKSAFLANIAHELRTPLHGILGYAKFGLNKGENATAEDINIFFQEIYQSGNGLLTLLNNVLDLSKLEAGKIEYNFVENEFSPMIDQVVSEMEYLAKERELNLILNVPEEIIIGVFDSIRITQVIRNLVSNAIKYSREGGDILISVEKLINDEGSQVKCSVQNQGVGIPDGEVEKIFEKFYQSTRTKSGGGGAGLGLAICRQIIDVHGGKIWAEPIGQEKTIFSFTLPI